MVVSWAKFSRLIGVLAVGSTMSTNMVQGQNSISAQTGQIPPPMGISPMYFEPNRGQAGRNVNFVSRGKEYVLYLNPDGLRLRLRGKSRKDNRATFRVSFLGQNPTPRIVGIGELLGQSNYFIGNDPKAWKTGIPHYQKVKYEDIYEGIDAIFYGTQEGRLEYDFIVHPHSDPSKIRMSFEGATFTGLDSTGDAVFDIEGTPLRLKAPIAYQEIAEGTVEIDAKFQSQENGDLVFLLGSYDPATPLVIDPVLAYSTYLGGTADENPSDVAVDSTGRAYVVGTTESTDFPTASPYQASSAGGTDIFVTRYDPTGATLEFSTYLGGSLDDSGRGIEVDGSGNIYIVGSTKSLNFPTQSPYQGSFAGITDAIVAKIDSTGSSLIFSTYFGGTDSDTGNDIDIDTSNNIYITGETWSSDLPTASPYQGSPGGGQTDAFLTKFNPAGTGLIFSTYLGGSANDAGRALDVDSSGNVYLFGDTDSSDFPLLNAFQSIKGLFGSDTFITKFDSSGSSLDYSTFLGGFDHEDARGIVVDDMGYAYVTGLTQSTDFPTQNPYQGTVTDSLNAYVSKIDPSGSSLAWSTYLGGAFGDVGYDIAIDSCYRVYVVGFTSSADFPVVDPLDTKDGIFDAYLTQFSSDGSLLEFSTYLGGSASDTGTNIAVDSNDDVYFVGTTGGSGFPLVSPQQGTHAGVNDLFVTKLTGFPACPSPTPTESPTATISATYTSTPTISLPDEFVAWPNPFNPATAVGSVIKFGPFDEGDVTIYTLAGEKVASAEFGSDKIARWDGRTPNGSAVAQGLYIYVVRVNGHVKHIGKIAIIR